MGIIILFNDVSNLIDEDYMIKNGILPIFFHPSLMSH